LLSFTLEEVFVANAINKTAATTVIGGEMDRIFRY